MATIIKTASSLPFAGAEFVPIPHADKLEGFFVMGGTIEDCCHNLIRGKADAVAVGSPTVGDRYLETTGGQAHFLQTAIPHSQDVTMIAVARALSDANSMIIGNYQSVSQVEPTARTFGTALSLPGLTAANNKVAARFGHGWTSGAAGSHNTANIDTTETINVGADVLISGWVKNSEFAKYVRNETANVQANTNVSTSQTADLGQTYRIGSSYESFSFNAKARIYAALIANTALTAQERGDIIAFLRDYYEDVWGMVL